MYRVTVSAETRRLWASFCRARNRTVARNLGNRWEPWCTTNLETGLPYSEQAAWELIATSLEDMSVEIKAKTLRNPPGAIGYEWLIRRPGNSSLYVKIQIAVSGSSVLGRSFHIAEYEVIR